MLCLYSEGLAHGAGTSGEEGQELFFLSSLEHDVNSFQRFYCADKDGVGDMLYVGDDVEEVMDAIAQT